MSVSMRRVIFRFKSPSGVCLGQPSPPMREALMLLSEAEELQPCLKTPTKLKASFRLRCSITEMANPFLFISQRRQLENIRQQRQAGR